MSGDPFCQEPPREAVIEGYACLFDQVDLGRDVIAPGAFRDSLALRGTAGVRLLYQHDPAEPIGVWSHLEEDARGLFVRGRLSLGVGRAREVAALMADRALDGLSIGFKAVEARAEPRGRIRRITRIDLWEISVVTFPMQTGARAALLPPLPVDALTRAARRLRDAVGRT